MIFESVNDMHDICLSLKTFTYIGCHYFPVYDKRIIAGEQRDKCNKRPRLKAGWQERHPFKSSRSQIDFFYAKTHFNVKHKEARGAQRRPKAIHCQSKSNNKIKRCINRFFLGHFCCSSVALNPQSS